MKPPPKINIAKAEALIAQFESAHKESARLLKEIKRILANEKRAQSKKSRKSS